MIFSIRLFLIWVNSICWVNGDGQVSHLIESSLNTNYLKQADSINLKVANFLLNNVTIHVSQSYYWATVTGKRMVRDESAYPNFEESIAAFKNLKVKHGPLYPVAIRYDWSGKHIISIATLSLTLENNNGELTGVWLEDATVKAALKAQFTEKGLQFSNTSFIRNDHYSPISGELWEFTNAVLQLAQDRDSAYIAGYLRLYSPTRKEPGKPFYIFLQRKAAKISTDEMISSLQVYPNPVEREATLSFSVLQTSRVSIKLTDAQGKTISKEAVETLLPGTYNRSIIIAGPPGIYLLSLQYDSGYKTMKIIKQ